MCVSRGIRPFIGSINEMAQALLRHAVESELESRLTEHFALKTEDGR